ncbi:MAG: IS200/IS605 family transposase [candidate division KSB1 bacterium]|nr:IS200/IS605 family transposase [candidate division KSB1 bacterium]
MQRSIVEECSVEMQCSIVVQCRIEAQRIIVELHSKSEPHNSWCGRECQLLILTQGGGMAIHSKVRIYVHLIWGTYERQRILTPELRLKIFRHLVERAKELDIIIVKMNIQPDHVHILFILPSNKTLAEIVQNLKGECSNWINECNLIQGKFAWQRGYGAFSVSASQLMRVENYIKNQDAHHRRKSFQEEYKGWAVRYGVWDEEDG